jgi:16S rRNA (adenine1518-N6/adenine1519-N6)-dimethyltransferase
VVSAAPRRSNRQRELGQNFLVDRNILDVIMRLADLTADDVVLEVGGGPGVLSQRLASLAQWVHVVEVDERLRDRLGDALARYSNVSLVFADALRLDLSRFSPPPGKMIANLPYGIAATLLLRTVAELPSLRYWLVMVQREVGERFAASPGTPAYGVPSVLAQLSCEVRVARPVSRSVFRPMPNVDSVLLEMRRVSISPEWVGSMPWVAAVVRAAFAHRRKALAGSLAIAGITAGGGAEAGSIRDRARAALVQLGHPADERAERLTPAEFVELARRLAGEPAP